MPRALISVSDKRGIVAFAEGLAQLGWEIVDVQQTRDQRRGLLPAERVQGDGRGIRAAGAPGRLKLQQLRPRDAQEQHAGEARVDGAAWTDCRYLPHPTPPARNPDLTPTPGADPPGRRILAR